MLIVYVHVHVKSESVADFRPATIENARSSVQEPSVARFDVVEKQDDRTRFGRNAQPEHLGGYVVSWKPLDSSWQPRTTVSFRFASDDLG
jgi:hypothetical protein